MAALKNKKNLCVDCKYWVRAPGNPGQPADISKPNGECRRNPPQLVGFMTQQGLGTGAGFPPCLGSNWCGEFEAAVAEAPETPFSLLPGKSQKTEDKGN
jgi:hypothetical protein